MKFFKRNLPLVLVFIVGMVTLASYYVPHRASQEVYLDTMNKWVNIIAAFAFLLGLLSLFYSHYHKIKKKADGWGYSLFVYIGFLAMIIPAIVSEGQQLDGPNLTSLGWAFRFIYNTLAATMFSVLAFYIVSTAFRSFRIKSMQAFVLFLAAMVLIMGRVPLGDLLWSKILGWTGMSLADLVEWIMHVPAVAARRGIMIGIAIGAAVISLKIIFGIERQYMGKD